MQANDTFARNRVLRAATFFSTAAGLITAGGELGSYLANSFIPLIGIGKIGLVIGAAAGFIAFMAMKHLFLITNNTTGMFVTLDQLQSLFGNDPHVFYEPGTHFCFPWEARFEQNNVSVEEVAEEFVFTAICKDGTLTGKGSFRLRPDFENPLAYLSGVAAVGKDLQDLVITKITDHLAQLTMEEAVREKDALNKLLKISFVEGNKPQTDFEMRFGVRLGDVTVSELLMSDEVQRTRGALNEGRVIAEGTAILLGYKNVAGMQRALNSRKISQDDVDRARREFRIISGNMDGAKVNRYEIDIKGLSPEVAAAISSAMNNQAIVKAVKGTGGKKGGTQ
jgi:regulator of protease activity HflC (stomatin/prohibitin superfamily)